MNTIGERFKMIIDAEKLNDFSFSKRLGKSHTAISKIVKGDSKPGFEILETVLLEFPNLNSDWLINGTGQMMKETKVSDKITNSGDYLQIYMQELEQKFQKLIDQKDKVIESQQYLIEHLEGQLGKPECVTETGVFKHPATAVLEEEGMALLA